MKSHSLHYNYTYPHCATCNFHKIQIFTTMQISTVGKPCVNIFYDWLSFLVGDFAIERKILITGTCIFYITQSVVAWHGYFVLLRNAWSSMREWVMHWCVVVKLRNKKAKVNLKDQAAKTAYHYDKTGASKSRDDTCKRVKQTILLKMAKNIFKK